MSLTLLQIARVITSTESPDLFGLPYKVSAVKHNSLHEVRLSLSLFHRYHSMDRGSMTMSNEFSNFPDATFHGSNDAFVTCYRTSYLQH